VLEHQNVSIGTPQVGSSEQFYFSGRGSSGRQALFEESAAWARARELRAYLAELAAEAKRTGQRLEGGELRKWIDWARAQTERIDPLPRRLVGSDDPSES
jgi:hypothetical protein